MIWNDKAWLAEVYNWIAEAVKKLGARVSITNIEQFHTTPWATVLRVPTSQGNLYFKASAIGWETAVTQTLYQLQPNRLPSIVAADHERNWLLLADGGLRVREAFGAGLTRDAWLAILDGYANFQLELASHSQALMVSGMPDRRLGKLPALFEWLLADGDWLSVGQEDGLTAAELRQLHEEIPHVTALCERLAAYNIPASLHHNDLHDGNIFLIDEDSLSQGSTNGRYRFFDWGDSSITHPFFSLRTAFVSIEGRFNLEEKDPVFDTFAAAYLRPWQAFETTDNLWEAYRLARCLWSISSAIKYKTQIQLLSLETTADFADYGIAVPILLQEFLAEAGAYDR